MVILTEAAATRKAILDSIRAHLLEAAKAGDVSIFYYAGHGSQMYNSKSTEADKKDETIVPADSYSGALDIRDKEFRRLFHEIVAHKITLTAMFDSCLPRHESALFTVRTASSLLIFSRLNAYAVSWSSPATNRASVVSCAATKELVIAQIPTQ
jgi:hypothetical protein